jgi:uracil-DNA glycosylase
MERSQRTRRRPAQQELGLEVGRDRVDDAATAWSERRDAATGCRNCELWQHATQTVFGEGPVPARVMLVGEQPGDKEDRAGRPFVGPAGRVFDDALAELAVARDELYVTNVVKHFKWTPSGSVRIHKSPNAREIAACAPWFEAELALVRPELLVCLGAVAAKALLGSQFRLTASRGTFVDSPLAPHVLATVHPSSILRTRDDRDAALAAFVDDLRTAFAALA